MDMVLKAVLEKYVQDSLVGVGALKGAPCQIDSITEITGGHRVTFSWIDTDEEEHTSTLDIMDGADGVGIADVDIDASSHVIVTLSDGTEIDAGSIEKMLTYDTMPSTEDLLSMSTYVFFATRGFYSATDGHGGIYRIQTSEWDSQGGLRIQSGVNKFLVPYGSKFGKSGNYIDVCRLGVREYSSYNEIDFDSITIEGTYADINSDIISRINHPTYGTYLQFPEGRFFFESTINISGRNCSIRGINTPKGTEATEYIGGASSTGGTSLFFPWLTNGQYGINISSGNIENICIYGNATTYNFHITRINVVDNPEQAISETIGTSGGSEVKCTGIYKSGAGFVKNVRVCRFYTGIKCLTSNIYLEGIFARCCHFGVDVGNDTKLMGVYGWDCHTLLRITGAITSAVQIRVDSCVNAVNLYAGSNLTVMDVDGDFCTDSLILIGANGKSQTVNNSVIIGIHGRCCTMKSIDNTQEEQPDVRDLEDTSGYGTIRVANSCSFRDNYVVCNGVGGANPFDGKEGEPTNYRTPNIAFTFGSSCTIVRNQFVVNGGTAVATATDIKKKFQSKSGATGRVDLYSGVFFIDGTGVRTYANAT